MGISFGDGLEEDARAFGLFGGQSGSINKLEIRYPDGRIKNPKTKEVIRDIPTGSIYRQCAGGGGGFGDPFQRSPELVAKDARAGLISVAKAKADYGVIVDPSTFKVDRDMTRKTRG